MNRGTEKREWVSIILYNGGELLVARKKHFDSRHHSASDGLINITLRHLRRQLGYLQGTGLAILPSPVITQL